VIHPASVSVDNLHNTTNFYLAKVIFVHFHPFRFHLIYLTNYSASSSPLLYSQKRSRHSADILPEFHAETPHATAVS